MRVRAALVFNAVEGQDNCVRESAKQGAVSGLKALVIAGVVVLGACRQFPAVNKALGTSARTALIVRRKF